MRQVDGDNSVTESTSMMSASSQEAILDRTLMQFIAGQVSPVESGKPTGRGWTSAFVRYAGVFFSTQRCWPLVRVSFFQKVARLFRASMRKRQASNAAARCADQTAVSTIG